MKHCELIELYSSITVHNIILAIYVYVCMYPFEKYIYLTYPNLKKNFFNYLADERLFFLYFRNIYKFFS